MDGLLVHCGAQKLTRKELAEIPTPAGTETHHPVPHIEIVNSLLETLAFRHINIVRDEYAVSQDGMKLFGVAELKATFDNCRFSIGIRNANDKSMRLGLTVGYRVCVCDNLAFYGDFQSGYSRNTRSTLICSMRWLWAWTECRGTSSRCGSRVQAWRRTQLADDEAKLFIYRAFLEEQLEAPKHLAREVHRLYFEPQYEEFTPRTLWSLSNAFTSAFKTLDPIPQFKATAKLGTFLDLTAGRGINS